MCISSVLRSIAPGGGNVPDGQNSAHPQIIASITTPTSTMLRVKLSQKFSARKLIRARRKEDRKWWLIKSQRVPAMSSAVGMSMRMHILFPRYLQYISTYNSLIEDADLWFWQLLWQLAFFFGGGDVMGNLGRWGWSILGGDPLRAGHSNPKPGPFSPFFGSLL
jgi:hypothetical protein